MSILIEQQDPKLRLWTADEYYDLFEKGYFHDERVELIEGEIVTMSPQNINHALGIQFLADILRSVFGNNYWVMVQMTLDILPQSVVDPDIAVVSGSARSYIGKSNLTSALLIAEVSATTLYFDRTKKRSLYAKAGIEDYWILNLIDRQLEIYRQPQADASQPYGFGYADTQVIDEQGSVSPLAKPNAKIDVADLLP